MKAEYILEAMEALDRCSEVLTSPSATPHERGTASANATVARIHLSVYSGISRIEIPIEEEA